MKRICIVCSKVDHSCHDIIYNEYTISFCNCGKWNKSCKALTPRTSSPNRNNVGQEVTSSSQLLPMQGKYYTFDNNHNKCFFKVKLQKNITFSPELFIYLKPKLFLNQQNEHLIL